MTLFCIIYYICSYVNSIPTIVKLIKTKSSNDYSIIGTAISVVGIIAWSLYIFTSKQNMLVYIGTVIDLVITLWWGYLIAKYFKKE